MWEHQRDWWGLGNRIRCLVGGYGAGKTLIGSKWAISMALENSPAPFAAISPTFPMARETIILTLRELCDGRSRIRGGKFSYTYNKTDHVFHLRHGSRQGKIVVLSGDRPERIKGLNLCGGWIDEPFIQEQEVFDQLDARTRHPKAKVRAIGLTGTPEQLNWGYELIEGEMRDSHDVGFVRAPTTANRALPDDYEANLRAKYDAKTAEAFLAGHFVDLSKGQVFHAFDATQNVVELERPPGSWLVCGMDFNVNPMAFLVAWTTGQRTHIFRYYEQPNSDTEYACQTLRADFPELVEIYPDVSCKQRHDNAPGGRTSLHIIRQNGFHANIPSTNQNPGRFESYQVVNGAYRHGKLTIDPSCKKLIGSIRRYSHELMKTKAQEAMSHGLDAKRYLVCGLHPIDRMEGRFGTY